MKHLSKTVISIVMAVSLGLSFSNAIADQDRIQPEFPEQDRLQSDDPDQDRQQSGDQTETSNEGSEDMYEHQYEYQYRYEEKESSQGQAVDDTMQPIPTQTHFRAWLSTNENIIENGALYQGDRVQLGSELTVDNEDVGKTVECLVLAHYKTNENAEGQVFMLAENGWEVWSGNFDELTGAKCQLGELHQIMAIEGELISGVFTIHFGYQYENGGIVASPMPLSFTVK